MQTRDVLVEALKQFRQGVGGKLAWSNRDWNCDSMHEWLREAHGTLTVS